MPGRGGHAISGGWATLGSSNNVPASLSINNRINNDPSVYTASETIEFIQGFESGSAGDAFEAYLTKDPDDNGGGNGGNNGAGGLVAGRYRYGFNGKENDNEGKGEGNEQDYGMRVYDPRLGRFLSVDPLQKTYPELTPFQFASNSPIASVDLDGLEKDWYIYSWSAKNGLVLLASATQTRESSFSNDVYDFFHATVPTDAGDVKRVSEYDGRLIQGYSKNIIVHYNSPDGRDGGFEVYHSFKDLNATSHADVYKSRTTPVEASPGELMAQAQVQMALYDAGIQANFDAINSDINFQNSVEKSLDNSPVSTHLPVGNTNKQATAANKGNSNAASSNSARATSTLKRTILYHYTTEEGQQSILNSKSLYASTKANNPNDARYGDGQYLSDIAPGTKTPAQLSKAFLNIPYQGRRFTNYVAIDVTGLNVVKGRDGVYVIPNQSTLNIGNRIVGSGKVTATQTTKTNK